MFALTSYDTRATGVKKMTVRNGASALVLLLVMIIVEGGGVALASEKEHRRASSQIGDVHIAPNGIVMPLDRILLIRKGSDYCAIKFIRFWTGKTEEDRYAEYESYSPREKSGDTNFLPDNVESKKGTASFSRLYGIGRLAFSLGNKEVKCGEVRMFWSGDGAVHFFARGQREGDYGIELAPTPWTDIHRVNLSDPRIRWYRYDTTRKRVNMPIDNLWSEPECGK